MAGPVDLERELEPFRGSYVEGVGGYKVERPLPGPLVRRARRADLVRRVRLVWYIRGPSGWKAEGDRVGLLERILGRLRGARPQTDEESRRYWEARGGEGYEREAFSAEWLEAARRTLGTLWERLSAEGVRSLLEVGCGPGRNLHLLRELGAPGLLGVDFSLSQLGKARERGFPVGQATARTLPVRDKSVDAVLFAQVLLHVPPPVAPALAEAVRAARRFVVLLENQHDDVGLESAATATPHCFRHNLVAHLGRVAPGAPIITLAAGDPGVRLVRL
jgi:SAM-dependent methyltransferase